MPREEATDSAKGRDKQFGSTGSSTFGQNQLGTPNWPFQNLPPSGGTSWTSPRIKFHGAYATKPVVYIAATVVWERSSVDPAVASLEFGPMPEKDWKPAVSALLIRNVTLLPPFMFATCENVFEVRS